MLNMSLLPERLAYIYKLRPDLEGEQGQTGLIRASQASKSVVNQWLHGGIKSIDIRYALNIERALGFCHIWLMTGDGDPLLPSAARQGDAPTPDSMSAKCETVDELRALTAYRLANETERKAFTAIVGAILGRADAERRNKA